MADILNLPWSIGRYGGVLDASGRTVEANGFAMLTGGHSPAHDRSVRRSAFIVLAVNHHDALVEALEDIASSDDVDNALDPERNKRVARAALAAVRGQK